MYSGSLSIPDSVGRLDLQATLESAQSFLWQRIDGEMYEETTTSGGDYWYYTVVEDDLVFARQQSGRLDWRATTDAAGILRRRLRLDDDLDEIFASFPEEPTLEEAKRQFPGLRVVRDPFFPCLVSFICSARMPVKRIHALQSNLAQEFGSAVHVDGSTYYAIPRPDELVAASESEL